MVIALIFAVCGLAAGALGLECMHVMPENKQKTLTGRTGGGLMFLAGNCDNEFFFNEKLILFTDYLCCYYANCSIKTIIFLERNSAILLIASELQIVRTDLFQWQHLDIIMLLLRFDTFVRCLHTGCCLLVCCSGGMGVPDEWSVRKEPQFVSERRVRLRVRSCSLRRMDHFCKFKNVLCAFVTKKN